MNNAEKLKKLSSEIGVELSDIQLEQFQKYYELLVEWNKVMNLTAITEYDDVVIKHFVDSMTLIKAADISIDVEKEEKLIDIGTGAGFPGIPLKIAFPQLKVTLLDSLNKRISFLNEVISELDLKNIETIHGRAEDFAKKPEYREQYDFAVSRAVANLSSLTEYCLPYVKVGGKFVPYKSGNSDEEIAQAKKAIFILGGKQTKTVDFNLPESDFSRTLVVIEKTQSTPKKYPRKAGLPTKEPIS